MGTALLDCNNKSSASAAKYMGNFTLFGILIGIPTAIISSKLA